MIINHENPVRSPAGRVMPDADTGHREHPWKQDIEEIRDIWRSGRFLEVFWELKILFWGALFVMGMTALTYSYVRWFY